MINSTTLMHNNLSQHGFTLVEVMVAMLIFSVGLLGLAGLQMEGMNGNNDAMLRTIATQHVYDAAERIRSSRGGFITTNDNGNTACSSTKANANCKTVAVNDFDTWSTLIKNTLPSGEGRIIPAGNSGAFQIIVRWDQHKTGVTGRNCPPQTSADMQCVQSTIIP